MDENYISEKCSMSLAESPNPPTVMVEDDRAGVSPETLRRAFLDNLFYVQGKFPQLASKMTITLRWPILCAIASFSAG